MPDPNRTLFASVVLLLAPLLDELVFVGGCTTGLFITDPAAGGIRPTRDVDAIVDVSSYVRSTRCLRSDFGHWGAGSTTYEFVTPALFIATKLEAFHGRGGDDVVASHDLEDIIAVVDGRPEIVGDVAAALDDVRAYIGAEIRALLDNRDFTEALAGFLLPDPASQERRPLLESRLRSLSTL